MMNFPKRLMPMIEAMTAVRADAEREDIDRIGKELAAERGLTGQLYITQRNIWDETELDLIYTWYYRVSKDKWINDTRKALNAANIKIVAEHDSKSGQYTSHWFELEDCGLQITSLRRGGKGIIPETLDEMHRMLEDSKKQLSSEASRDALIESAKKKLTDEEKRALGIHV